MKYINLLLAFFAYLFIFAFVNSGCTKVSTDPPVIFNGLLYKVVDSMSSKVYDTLEYNSDKKLIKFYSSNGGGSANSGFVDTFMYNNKLIVRSQYNLGATIRLTSPYAFTNYQYQNNVPTRTVYYLGNSTLLSISDYTFDSLGRVSQIHQACMNDFYSVPTYTSRFEYDANSNLSKVYLTESTRPEYLKKEYLNYDSKENPYYKLPWLYDYNIYEYNDNKISKNNVGAIKIYAPPQSGVQRVDQIYSYSYEYNDAGKVSKSRGPEGTKYYFYD